MKALRHCLNHSYQLHKSQDMTKQNINNKEQDEQINRLTGE